jgi:hypothetical protein
MSSGPWHDERRRPGFLPDGRRRWMALAAVIVVGIAARAAVPHLGPSLLGALVVGIGLTGVWLAARLDKRRLNDQRYTRGPGWFIGLAISKLPLPVARAAWLALGLAIIALGVAEIVSQGR